MSDIIKSAADFIKKACAATADFFKKLAAGIVSIYKCYADMVRDYRKNKAASAARPFALFAGLGYFLLIFVVAYGAKNHVYDGFGPVAPWVIGAIFAAMICIRLWQFIKGAKAFLSAGAEKEGSDGEGDA